MLMHACMQADFPNYKSLCCQVQDVLLDMAFDLGQVRSRDCFRR